MPPLAKVKVIEGLILLGNTVTDFEGETDQLKSVGAFDVCVVKVKEVPEHKVAEGLTIVAVGTCAKALVVTKKIKNILIILFINLYKFTKNSNVFTLSAKSVITGCCE